MRFLRSAKGCTKLDENRIVVIRKQLGAFSMNDKITKIIGKTGLKMWRGKKRYKYRNR
jgi:hypothetical protein